MVGRVGSSPVYAVYTQETDYLSTATLALITVTYYSNLVVGSNVSGENGVCIFYGGRNDLFSITSNTIKYYHIFRQLKVVPKWVGLGRVQSFMLIVGFVLGLVGLVHVTCGSRWVGSRKLDPRPTLPCRLVLVSFQLFVNAAALAF